MGFQRKATRWVRIAKPEPLYIPQSVPEPEKIAVPVREKELVPAER